MKNFELTLGSKDFLLQVAADFPERKLKLLQLLTDNKSFLLLDLADKKPIFKSGLTYMVLQEKFSWEVKDFYCFDHFKLNTIEQKEFKQLQKILLSDLKGYILGQRLQQNFEFVLLSIWQSLPDYLAWKQQNFFWTANTDLFNSRYSRIFKPV
jgi:hypothetical protein